MPSIPPLSLPITPEFLIAIANEIQALERELALTLTAESKAKLQGWVGDDPFAKVSDKTREMNAKANAIHLTEDVFRIKSELEGLRVQLAVAELILKEFN